VTTAKYVLITPLRQCGLLLRFFRLIACSTLPWAIIGRDALPSVAANA
jgi:hypothetical protein